ncbi:hypothetical protein CHARACLAT_030264 [Characodon lateralis]|uniref:Ig-like domain-containing protein n=1 Tax=Characodon lateralis TaxID=208331 RepID=A0ABU7D599_9TELE|nr:hypothetical protein [Characodon lateralis]
MYHCAVLDWNENTWRGTYLSIKGNNERTVNYTVLQRSRVANTADLGDSATLECSILSDSNYKTCPGDVSVFWFRARSHKSHPEIIFMDEIPDGDCTAKHDRKCVYSFFKNVSISEFGKYYCAIASCGEILFGNGTTLEVEKSPDSTSITLVIVIICLIISVILHIAIICHQTLKKAKKQNKCKKTTHDHLDQQEDNIDEDENGLNYAALHFPGGKVVKGKKNKLD